MRNKIRYIRLIGLIFVLIVGSSLTFAQNKSKRKSAKKPLVEVVSIVTDEKGSPLKNVSIICGEGAVVLYTDAKGRFQTKVENDATVMVEALGYEDKVYKLTGSNIVPEKIVLKKEPLFLTEESLVNRADGGKTYKGNEVGATSVLENGQFGTFPDLTLTNMLQGKMLGLQVRSTVSGLGNNTPDLFIRGQHGMSENTAIVIIDGVERPAADLIPEEIERIELLKDATAKIIQRETGLENGTALCGRRELFLECRDLCMECKDHRRGYTPLCTGHCRGVRQDLSGVLYRKRERNHRRAVPCL